jgi:hypothetical protein
MSLTAPAAIICQPRINADCANQSEPILICVIRVNPRLICVEPIEADDVGTTT